MALRFDLALPLAPQLAAARVMLVGRQHALVKAGSLSPRTLRAARPVWACYLRLLDAERSGTPPALMAELLGLAEIEGELAAARAMAQAGYRRILLLED